MEFPQGLSDYITTELIPINKLSEQNQKLLLENLEIETYRVGSYLFQQGEVDDNVYYLLTGKINMMATDESSFIIDTSVDQCLYPIGQMQPRQYSAYVLQPTQTLTISKTLFDSVLESDMSEPSIDPDGEPDLGYDWMTRFLQSRIFAKIPPQNIQKIFELFEEISVKEKNTVINQGDEGDYFYIIKNGLFEVTRCMERQKKTYKLAILHEGDTFGEESLLGDMPRNASVTAKTDGTLMRITKEAFLSLIRDPAIKCLNYDEARRLIESGAIWLDVRNKDEYMGNSIDDSLNFPLNTLRIQMNKLDMESEYVVYCDNGARSAIAAYLLLSKGYTVSHLKGGIMEYQNLFNMEPAMNRETDIVNNIEQPVVSGPGTPGHATEAQLEYILSRQSDNHQLTNALKTVMANVFRQLEQALKEKAEAEVAKNIAEQKLEALYLQIRETNQRSRLRLI